VSTSELELDPYDNTKYQEKSDERSKEDREDEGKPIDKPADDESGGGAGWVVFWILFLLLAGAGIGWWVKTRREMGMPLNPFAKDYSFAAGYGAGDDSEGMKATIS
jgi:hypothetical protein